MNWYRSKELLKKAQSGTYANVPEVMGNYEEVLDSMRYEESFPKGFAIDMLDEIMNEVKGFIEDDPVYEAFGYMVMAAKDQDGGEWGRGEAQKILPRLNQNQLVEFAEYFEAEQAFSYQVPESIVKYLSTRGIEIDEEGSAYIDSGETPAPVPQQAEEVTQQPPFAVPEQRTQDS